MDKKEATKFIHDWLWESEDRQTEEESWLGRYIADVASMVSAATKLQQEEIQQLRNLLREAVEKINLVRQGNMSWERFGAWAVGFKNRPEVQAVMKEKP